MKVKNGKIRCLFCDSLVKCLDGEFSRLTSHIEHEHEVSFKLDFVLAISFLSEKEIDILINKMKPRMDNFLDSGEVIDDDLNIFTEEDNAGGETNETNLDVNIIDINSLEKFNQSNSNDIVTQDQKKNHVDAIQSILLEDYDSSDDENDTKLNIVKVENTEILMQDELNCSASTGRTYNLRRRKRGELNKENFTKPCKINLKKANVAANDTLEESFDVENSTTEIDIETDTIDIDLEPEQEELLQNVTCEMNIGEDEVSYETSSDDTTPNLKNVNLAEKFGPNQCKLCFSEFTKYSQLQRHNENVHKDDQEAFDLTFFTLKDLVHTCNMCVLGFLTENILNNHKKLKHRVEVKSSTLKCDVCEKVVKYSSYKAHMLIHNGAKVECKLCYKEFTLIRYLQNHKKKVHVNESEFLEKALTDDDLKFACDICQKKFVTDNCLNYHKKSHEVMEFESMKKAFYVKNDNKFQCKLCYSTFKQFAGLNSHITFNHPEDKALLKTPIKEADKVYNCDDCELKFVTSTVLKYHKSRMHESKTRFVRCKLCSKVVRRDKFSSHRNTHTRKNMHSCLLCYTTFKCSSNLKRHEERIHKSEIERDFIINGMGKFESVCSECNLRFLTDDLLQSHIRKHKVERLNEKFDHLKKEAFNPEENRYGCKLCYVKYREYRNLANHFEAFHKDETDLLRREINPSELIFDCVQCELKFVSQTSLDIHNSKSHVHQTEVEKLRAEKRKQRGNQFDHLKMEMYSSEGKGYTCKLCYINYRDFRKLASHFESIHGDETQLLLRKIEPFELLYSCEECDLKFVSRILVECHSSRMHDQDASNDCCKLCDITYKTSNGLWHHKLKIHKLELDAFRRDYEEKDKVFSCTCCDKKYVTEISLNYHVGSRHPQVIKKPRVKVKADKVTYCKLCDLNFKRHGGFVQHKKKIHKSELDAFKREYEERDLIFDCTACTRKFATQIALDHHMSRKHYTLKRNLMKKVKLENQEKYCQLCYIVYKEARYLQKHKKKIHANEMEAFNIDLIQENMEHLCTKCNKTFYSQNTLDHHIHRKHNKGNIASGQFLCQLCHVSYNWNGTLKKHIETKHNDDMHLLEQGMDESLLKHICATCEKRFIKEEFLQYHQKYVHKEVQKLNKGNADQFYCKLCHVTYARNDTFKKHMELKHKDDVDLLDQSLESELLFEHSCENCDKRFIKDDFLQYHKKYEHKGLKEKTSYCRLCYIDFKFNSNLKAHISKIHTSKEERDALSIKMEVSLLPYGCKFCKKRFLTENIQRYHNIHSHKEEKRQDLSCEYCNQVFVFKHGRKKIMENHMRIKHNLDDYKVDEKEQGPKEMDSVRSFMRVLNSLNE